MWTTSPDRSRAFWHSVYERLLEHLGVPNPNGLADDLYAEFTDLSNYALFPDVVDTIARLRAAGLLLGRRVELRGVARAAPRVAGRRAVVRRSGHLRAWRAWRSPTRPSSGSPSSAPAWSRRSRSTSGTTRRFDTRPAEHLGMLGVLIDRRGRFPDHAGVRITTLDDLPSVIGAER